MNLKTRLVGVVHLPALPGAPLARRVEASKLVADITKQAVQEAKILGAAGFDAVVIENFGDTPFFKTTVPAITISAMSIIAAEVRAVTKLKLGINVLRNDGNAALAIAAASGADFIRVNVLSGVVATDQGLIEGSAAELMRARASLEAMGSRISVWGDVLVKHARTLSTDDIELAAEEVALRANADALIITGTTTGRAVDRARLEQLSELGIKTPIYLGSGVTPENISQFKGLAHGVIVGSALRRAGRAGAPLESARVKAFAKAFSGFGA